jgi:hypothetical protein
MRDSVARLQGAPRSFACPSCDVVLHDGVDYTWCPMCLHPVDWVDLDKPLWCCETCDAIVNALRADWPHCVECDRVMTRVHAFESPPAVVADGPGRAPAIGSAIGSAVITAAVIAQLVVLALDPLGLVFIAPLLLFAVLAACAFLLTLLGSLGELSALARDQRTRVIHGLEHACLKTLERDGLCPRGGQTYDGFFEIAVRNDGRASIAAVRQATYEAMTRIAHGESSLAFDPRCGTSRLVALALTSAVILAGAIIALVAGAPPGLLAATTILTALLAWLASRPLGLLAQRAITVSTRFAAAAVHRIVRVVSASGDTATFLVFLRIDIPA